MKKEPTEWEKMFVNHVSDKGSIPRIYKVLLQLKNKQKHKQPDSKMAKNLDISQKKYTNGQQIYEKILNITNY